MISKSPAFQFYPKDWLADGNVRAMGHEARGIYIDLLAMYWNDGGLPADPQSLARRVCVPFRTFQRLWPLIEPCFQRDGDSITSLRLEAEKVKQAAYRSMQQEKGLKSAKSRVSNKTYQPRLNPVDVRLEPEVNSPSPFPSSSPKEQIQKPIALNGSSKPSCPNCGVVGALQRCPPRNGNPAQWWCRTLKSKTFKGDGCGENFKIDHPDILSQVTPFLRKEILASLPPKPVRISTSEALAIQNRITPEDMERRRKLLEGTV